VSASQLDSGLVCLGTGIAEEDFIGAAVVGQPFGEHGLLRDVIQIGDVVKL